MRKKLNERRLDWIERNESMDNKVHIIQQWLDKLDNEMCQYEARWGVGTLQRLVEPSVSNKWDMQMDRLNRAIEESDIDNVQELVEGSIRGLGALENNAVKSGHKPHGAPVAWSARMPTSGKELLICATRSDAALVQGNPHRKDVAVWTLDEVATFIENNGQMECVKKKNEPVSTASLRNSINGYNGVDDTIPF